MYCVLPRPPFTLSIAEGLYCVCLRFVTTNEDGSVLGGSQLQILTSLQVVPSNFVFYCGRGKTLFIFRTEFHEISKVIYDSQYHCNSILF